MLPLFRFLNYIGCAFNYIKAFCSILRFLLDGGYGKIKLLISRLSGLKSKVLPNQAFRYLKNETNNHQNKLTCTNQLFRDIFYNNTKYNGVKFFKSFF